MFWVLRQFIIAPTSRTLILDTSRPAGEFIVVLSADAGSYEQVWPRKVLGCENGQEESEDSVSLGKSEGVGGQVKEGQVGNRSRKERKKIV